MKPTNSCRKAFIEKGKLTLTIFYIYGGKHCKRKHIIQKSTDTRNKNQLTITKKNLAHIY